MSGPSITTSWHTALRGAPVRDGNASLWWVATVDAVMGSTCQRLLERVFCSIEEALASLSDPLRAIR